MRTICTADGGNFWVEVTHPALDQPVRSLIYARHGDGTAPWKVLLEAGQTTLEGQYRWLGTAIDAILDHVGLQP